MATVERRLAPLVELAVLFRMQLDTSVAVAVAVADIGAAAFVASAAAAAVAEIAVPAKPHKRAEATQHWLKAVQLGQHRGRSSRGCLPVELVERLVAMEREAVQPSEGQQSDLLCTVGSVHNGMADTAGTALAKRHTPMRHIGWRHCVDETRSERPRKSGQSSSDPYTVLLALKLNSTLMVAAAEFVDGCLGEQQQACFSPAFARISVLMGVAWLPCPAPLARWLPRCCRACCSIVTNNPSHLRRRD